MTDIEEIDNEFMQKKIDVKLGYRKNEVTVNPANNTDYSIMQISEDKVMGMASDDALYMSELPPDKSSYLTFHRSAGKLSSSGIMPEYLGINLHLPRGIKEEQLSHFWNSISIESKKFQVSITGRSLSLQNSVKEPFVGGTTVIGTSMKNFYVTPADAMDGDRVLLTKTPGLEAATLLAHIFPGKVEQNVGQYNQKMAHKLFFKTSTIQEAQECLKFGLGKNGVTSMKAVGRSGILGALEEFSATGDMGLVVDFEKIPLYDEVKEICSLFDLNPYTTASMGSLLITLPKAVSEDLIKNLVGNGIDVSDIGKVDRNVTGLRIEGVKESVDSPLRSFYNSLSAIRG